MSTINLGLMENRLSQQEAKRDIKTEDIKVFLKFAPLAAVAVAILILAGVSNFRLFHMLSELFAVFIAFFTFFTALLMFKITRNNFIMYLGCGYLWVGMLDLAHAFFFKDVGIISGSGTNVSAQLWISARYLEAFLLLTSFYFLKRKVNTRLAIAGFGIFSTIFYSLIAAGIFPDCFVEGSGLTTFKKASEYAVIGILFITLLRQKHIKHLLEENVYNKIFLAIAITIISETLFTLYSSNSDGFAIAGHITKIFSFLFIFLAVIPGTFRESHEKYLNLFEYAHNSIFFIDPNSWKFIEVNRNAALRLNYTKSELLELTFRDISSPASTIDVSSIVNEVNLGQSVTFEHVHRKKDGSDIPVEIRFSMVMHGGKKVVMFIVRDIAKRKEAERKTRIKQQQLVLADRMKSLGILTGSVAHEISNPNGFIMANAPILMKMWEGALPILDKYEEENGDFALGGMPYQIARERVKKHTKGILKGANRINDLVEKLNRFIRKESSEKKPIDINGAIQSALDFTEIIVRKSSCIMDVNYKSDLPEVMVNMHEIEQIIINMITNSCHAFHGKESVKELTLSLSSGVDEKSGYVTVTVADNGCGIPKKNLHKIFDPFFTTKQSIGGTGLGLSISQSIVKDHKGVLEFRSEEGKGTTAILKLPPRYREQ